MINPMQDLQALGLNPFAVTLLAESMLKSAYVKHYGSKPLTFEFPVRRGHCEGWAGVRITIEAVPAAGVQPPGAQSCPRCGAHSQAAAENICCGEDCPLPDTGDDFAAALVQFNADVAADVALAERIAADGVKGIDSETDRAAMTRTTAKE